MPSGVTPAVDFERQISEWRARALASRPAHVRALSKILRRGAETGRLGGLIRWCHEQRIPIRRDLSLFRDFLITQMIELKDLEPSARARLRARTLASEDSARMSDDYRAGLERGTDLRCRDCRWFIQAPRDGDSADADQTKSCVELGTKGIDIACLGFQSR
jgi:hypothetical protein